MIRSRRNRCTRAATSQGYSPEWYLTSTALADTTAFARTYDQDQWKHAFGVSTLAARVDPSISGTLFLWNWYFGTPSPTVTGGATTVPNLQTLYAVLQGMGPDVTPQNFKDALFAADATPSAVSQPSLSWGDKGFWPYDDYQGIDDATVMWWDPTATGPDEIQRNGTGMYRYVDGGKRYLPGQWPDDAHRSCSSGRLGGHLPHTPAGRGRTDLSLAGRPRLTSRPQRYDGSGRAATFESDRALRPDHRHRGGGRGRSGDRDRGARRRL